VCYNNDSERGANFSSLRQLAAAASFFTARSSQLNFSFYSSQLGFKFSLRLGFLTAYIYFAGFKNIAIYNKAYSRFNS
jgi:hypothetical protein